MNKITMIAVAAMVAGIASADLSIDWNNSTGAVSASNGGNDWLVGSTIQLMWSASGAITTAGQYPKVGATEFVLDTGLTVATSFWSGEGGIFTDADVGGNNINSGFFFTRVFESDGSAGDYFLDIAMSDGASWVYSSTDPLSTYKTSVVSGANWVGANGTTVVPEPATVGLFGLGALSAWFIRRSKKAQQEEA